MPRKPKRLTRAEKVALSNLTEDYRDARACGAASGALDGLVSRGLALSLLESGEMAYRLSPEGAAFLENFKQAK